MPTRAAVPCAAALLLAAALQGSHAFRIDTSCDGSTVALAVRTAGTGPQPAALVYAQPSPLGPRLPLTRARATALPIVAGPACGPLPPADGGAVVLPRGTCSFADKAAAARGAGAGLLVVFQAGNDTQECFAMGVPANASLPDGSSLPPSVSVDAASGALLLAAAEARGSSVAAWQPDLRGPDWAAAILAVLAIVGVALGAELAARDEARARGLLPSDSARHGPTPPDDARPETVDSPAAAAAAVVAMACALLLAYVLPRVVGILLTGVFLVASGDGLARGLRAVVGAASPRLASVGQGGSGVTPVGATSAATAAAAAGAWLAWGPRTLWPLHDTLALALVVSVPRALRVPSLATATTLLLLAAANDVWWVFVQPRVTGGPSVMVAVATSASTPALALLAPLLRGGPRAGFALLGLGDIAVPGAAVACLARWDAKHLWHSAHLSALARRPAAAAALAGYAAGLVATYAALLAGVGGGAGQPALLYLAPCTLGAAGVDALLRGELRARWAGLDAEAGGAGGDDEEGAAALVA